MSVKNISRSLTTTKSIQDIPYKTPSTWTRDPNWLTLPSVTDLEKFVGLVAVLPNSNYIALSANTSVGSYQIDWGDGTIETITSGTNATHIYDYTTFDVSNTTLITHNGLSYKQAIISVTPIASNLTAVSLNVRHPSLSSSNTFSQWLDIAVNGNQMQTFTVTASSQNVIHRMLEKAYIGNLKTGSSVTYYSYMFYNCSALRDVSFYSTSVANTMLAMFSGCSSLTQVPLFDTQYVANMYGMFQNCSSLTQVPLFNTRGCTNMSTMFSGCVSLITVPLFNTQYVANMSSMFNQCYELESVPLFNTASCTNFNAMFNYCYNLTTVPLFNTAAATNIGSMFYNCASLTSVPLFNTQNVTNISSMFFGCTALLSVPLFNTIKVIDISYMFYNCFNLTSIPLFNLVAATNTSYMFQNCSALKTIPAMDFSKVTNISSMFSGCSSLVTLPALDFSKVTTNSFAFQNCVSLVAHPTITFNIAAISFNQPYIGSSITSIPAINMDLNNSYSTAFVLASLSKIDAYGMKQAFTVGYRLSKTSLETLANNLGKAAAGGSTILTITGNPGIDTLITIASGNVPTVGSYTFTAPSTTGIAVGMTAVNVSTASVSFTGATAYTVNLVGHGLLNGDMVLFPSIGTATGIVAYTKYYVVNALTDTFQVALTVGGTRITFSSSATGSVAYRQQVVSFTSTSVTMDRPYQAVGTLTRTFRRLDMSAATLNGWLITY